MTRLFPPLTFALLLAIIPAAAAAATSVAGHCTLSSNCQPASVEISPDGRPSFIGIIDDDSVNRAEALLKPGSDLLITSAGGSRASAVRFGEFIYKNNIRVVADSECISACGLYIFLPAKRKILSKSAYVYLHSPSALWSSAISENPGAFSAKEISAIRKNASQELRLYRMAGIDPALLQCVVKLEGRDFSKITREPETLLPKDSPIGSGVHVGGGEYAWVSFSAEALAHYGVSSVGEYWFPTTAKWRRGSPDGPSVAWVDGGEGDWCRPSPGRPGAEQ